MNSGDKNNSKSSSSVYSKQYDHFCFDLDDLAHANLYNNQKRVIFKLNVDNVDDQEPVNFIII